MRRRAVVGALIGGVVIGAMLLSPAGAHVTSGLTHLFGHLDQRYAKRASAPSTFSMRMSAGDPDKTVKKIGPFTFKAACLSFPILGTQAVFEVFTSSNNGILLSEATTDPDFDSSEGGVTVAFRDDWIDPGTFFASRNKDFDVRSANNGTVVTGVVTAMVNAAGDDCRISGVLTRVG